MWRLVLCLTLVGCLCACAGLGGEPEIIMTLAPQPTPSQAIVGDWRPDIGRGARIYAENCTECHGPSGDGRGDLVAAGSVTQPIDMTDLSQTAEKSPLEWFQIISEGRIENLMPPWSNALSEAERWDVTLYAYSLAYDEALLQRGETLWQERCGDCELPGAIPPVFSDREYAQSQNAERFDGALTEDDALAAGAYARWQSLASAADASDMGAEEGESAFRRGDFSGQVLHGGADGIVPPETIVQLQYGNADLGFNEAETTIDSDGRFVFADLPLTSEYTYLVSARYKDRVFSRRLLPGHPAATEYAQTITLYDVANDPGVISVARIELFLNPVNLDDIGSGLLIRQIVAYDNASDRLFTSGRGFDDGREASLLLQMPEGARIMGGDANGRYVPVEGLQRVPDSIIDTWPVAPGAEHEIIVEYFLPYEQELDFAQRFNNQVDAEVHVTLPRALTVDGEGLRLAQAEEETSGSIVSYSGRLSQMSQPQLQFRISGDPFATSSDDHSLLTSDDLGLTLLGAGALGLAGMAGWALRRRRSRDASRTIDGLVAAIAQLDEAHERGQINHDAYHHRRRALKGELAVLMGEADDES